MLGLFNLGRAYGRKGQHDQAIATLEQARSRAREDPGILAALSYEHGVSGRRPDAARTLALLRQASKDRYVPALYFAGIYTGIGDHERAMEYLARAYDERCDYVIYLANDPMADPLRSDPRHAQLLNTAGLAR